MAEKKEGEKKKKKISKMTLQEIDIELKNVQEKMGGTSSGYAQCLIKRKKTLAAV